MKPLRKTHQNNQLELVSLKKRINRALRNEGPVWTEHVAANSPAFKPLDGDERRTPIISVLNLKGGVGKTTIAANLGACLDSRGYGTLLIDLDLQGSLTSMFLAEGLQEDLFTRRRVLGEFLNQSFGRSFRTFSNTRTRSCRATDRDWCRRPTTCLYGDESVGSLASPRGQSRSAFSVAPGMLQLKRITSAYDMILLDCPPVLNIFCINAVAASDYLIIPIMPSVQAMNRVPVLLKLLKELKEHINPRLRCSDRLQ